MRSIEGTGEQTQSSHEDIDTVQPQTSSAGCSSIANILDAFSLDEYDEDCLDPEDGPHNEHDTEMPRCKDDELDDIPSLPD